MDLSSLEPYRVQPSSNWHNAEALKKEAPEIEYRSDAEEAADQWALVPEDDSNGIGIKQSKKLYDPVEPSWFIPRDDPGRTYPSTTESAVACAMSNALRTDVLVNSERYDSTVLASLKYHAPYLKFDPEEALKDTTSNIVAGMRKTQVLSAEVDAEIRALPTFVQDTRFYLFADKVALAREANLFACMKLLNETDVRVLAGGPIPHYPGHNECQETCDDVLTEDEWLMIKMADCGKAPEEYPVFPGSPAGIPAFQPPYDPGANPGFPEIPPVMMQHR